MKNRKSLFIISVVLVILGLSGCKNGTQTERQAQPAASPSPQNFSALTLVPNTNFPNASFGNEGELMILDRQTLAPGQGTLTLNLTMPDGYKLNTVAPFTASLRSSGESVVVDEHWANYQEVNPTMPLDIPLVLRKGAAVLDMNLTIYWCEAVQQTLCYVERRQLTIPLTVVSESANKTARVELSLTPPILN
ncbi:MAG: hypothetical protein K8L91_27055 [Anaerolineae bacterium]|nr:hypothetical protein [Anaerolineae bacterium]